MPQTPRRWRCPSRSGRPRPPRRRRVQKPGSSWRSSDRNKVRVPEAVGVARDHVAQGCREHDPPAITADCWVDSGREEHGVVALAWPVHVDLCQRPGLQVLDEQIPRNGTCRSGSWKIRRPRREQDVARVVAHAEEFAVAGALRAIGGRADEHRGSGLSIRHVDVELPVGVPGKFIRRVRESDVSGIAADGDRSVRSRRAKDRRRLRDAVEDHRLRRGPTVRRFIGDIASVSCETSVDTAQL